MHTLRWVLCGLLIVFATASGYAQGPVATFNGIGDLSGGPFASTVRDATKVDGVIHAVGASATVDQCLVPTPGCTQTSYNFDTPAIWSWDGSNASLSSLPSFVTLTNPGTAATFASAITPDASYIAGQARSSAAGNAMLATRVTRSGVVNLNLNVSPFPSLADPTGAVAISSNGSVLYGTQIVGSFIRATRWDIDSSTSLTIPLLSGTTGGNFPAPRGTSSDGLVMVGSSFSTSPELENLRGFRYVHGTPGTVTAVPMLAGGTWNNPVAISADGNLVLVEGNSTSLPNGEMYIYNATSGLNTRLGSPNTLWGANGFGGITADGSVAAVSFASVDGSNRYAYFHNSLGWFHLASALGAAGVDVGAAGWSQLDISGMSSDGTLVFGNGLHNGNTEGFVAEFPAGYLSGFSLAPNAPANTSIVGTWILPHPGISGDTNPEVLLVMADGTYFEIENSGFERGSYSWNAATGEFKVGTNQDTNGE